MRVEIDKLNKIFESRVRLGIMSILMIEDKVDFTTLKEALNLTDGNLASHLKTLEKIAYVKLEKSFLGRKPNTTYNATLLGKVEFNKHIKALENFLKKIK